MIYRCILPNWAGSALPKVVEGEFSAEKLTELNCQGYNIYYLPNCPSHYDPSVKVDGSQIDDFHWVFVDMDLKDGAYPNKDSFISELSKGAKPTLVTDSGNGIHAYWYVEDLDAMSYLKLQRRLMRKYNTDAAVGQIFQLMRYPGSVNTKDKDNPKICEVLYQGDDCYTCEQLDAVLPPITHEDEEYCKQHYDKTYNLKNTDVKVDDVIPPKFLELLRDNAEIKELFSADLADRSAADFRLGHVMHGYGFTREEAMSVLVNTEKALSRSPVHRLSYAANIVDKIWQYEETKDLSHLSESVADILAAATTDESRKGKRFPCYRFFDGTEHGFRLSQVLGLCAGVGVGKTAIALNLFKGFVEYNPEYIHMFVSLEQPGREIADRWRKMTQGKEHLHDKVHVLSNYNADGTYRHLSLDEIEEYIIKFQEETGKKVGCVCIDHIGVLKKQTKNGENQGLMDVCSALKKFAIRTNTLLVIQSQTNREKAGIGDLELFKDAAYGTQHFESFVDFLMVAWQPLKRMYDNTQCPRVTAYKFAKIRFKSKEDKIIEDQCYRLIFDPATETLKEMIQKEEQSADFFEGQAVKVRNKDRKTNVTAYKSLRWEAEDGKTNPNPHS